MSTFCLLHGTHRRITLFSILFTLFPPPKLLNSLSNFMKHVMKVMQLMPIHWNRPKYFIARSARKKLFLHVTCETNTQTQTAFYTKCCLPFDPYGSIVREVEYSELKCASCFEQPQWLQRKLSMYKCVSSLWYTYLYDQFWVLREAGSPTFRTNCSL
jgi:hypothetical protein